VSTNSEIMPVVFGDHFGALHRPCEGGTATDMAVVICPTLGRDGRSAYRTLFSWAETLAAQGFSVLRYDALGEGDSAPIDAAADQCAAWLDGVVQAADFVRRQTGACRLVLAGLRMGGALALAASARVEPDGLLLFAPLVNGEAWLRELRFSAAIQKQIVNEAEGLQVDGLHLSAATVRSLRALDTSRAKPAWRAAFLATPGADGGLAARLGASVTTTRFEGYKLLFKEPHLVEAPTKVLAEATAWLVDFAGEAVGRRPPVCSSPAQMEGSGWLERPLTFGDGLRGVLCTPRGRASGRAVLIGNTAADPRAGVGNFAARCSRALASEGVAAVRFDFQGIGESPGELGDKIDIYAIPRVSAFLAAAEVLSELGYDEISLVGVCTGGFHAVHAVLESKVFKRAVAFNAWLVFRPHWSLALRSETADPKRRPSVRPEAPRWWKVLHGEVDVPKALARTLKQVWTSLWPDARCRATRRAIRRACREGAEIHVISGRGDVALRGLEADFGLNCSWLRRRQGVSVKVLPRLDHALYFTGSQDNAIAELFQIMDLGRPSVGGATSTAAAAEAARNHSPARCAVGT
jgi:alpha-beta hydrolase superfamily lysophospholipase